MGLYKTKGIVLRSIKLGEADKIVTLFSPGRGKIKAVAKGIRKTKSKFGSRLEPFTYIDMLLYEGRELDIITQAEILISFKEIRADLEKLKYGSVMLELVDKVGQEREEAEDIFSCLLSALKALKGASERLLLLLGIFELKLMSAAGFHPHVKSCALCGRDIGGEPTFSFKYGGLLCSECRLKDEEALLISKPCRHLIEQVFKVSLNRWQQIEAPSSCQSELFKLAQLFTLYYLERDLKSPRLLKI